jgi:hypothetical protein
MGEEVNSGMTCPKFGLLPAKRFTEPVQMTPLQRGTLKRELRNGIERILVRIEGLDAWPVVQVIQKQGRRRREPPVRNLH